MFFKYLAVSKDGKRYKDVIQANGLDEAISIIESQELEIISIKRSFFYWQKKLSDFDIFLMFDFLSKFLSNGVTLDKALDMISSCSLKCSKVCLNIKNFIVKGSSLSDAFKGNRSSFDKNHLSLFTVIDDVGSISEFCSFLANYYKKIDKQKKQIKQKMKYPIILSLFSGIMFFIIIKFLVPNILMIITETGKEIPIALSILSYISANLEFYFLSFIFFIFLLFLFRKKVSNWMNIIPIVRKYRFYRDFSFFFYISQVLLSNKIQVINAFKIAKNSMVCKKNIDTMIRVCENVESGFSIKEAFEESGVENNLSRLIGLYEKSANLKSGFLVISDIYESEMFDILDKAKDYVQPITLSVIAFLIGIIAYSVMIPIYNSFA